MTRLSIYKIIFMCELLVAEALFCFYCKKNKHFILKLILSLGICFTIAILYPLQDKYAYSGWYTSIMFLILFIVTFIPIKLCFKVDIIHAFFIGITAYTVQHLSYQILSLLSNMFDLNELFGPYSNEIIDLSKLNEFTLIYVLVYISVYSTIYGFSFLSLSKKMNKSDKIEFKTRSFLFLSGLILLVDIVLNAFIVYIKEDYNKSYSIILSVYNLICCIFVFYIQINAIQVSDIKKESKIISAMLHVRDKQYQIQKENINLINQKCHDIKYQLRQCMNNNADEINQIVSIYDSCYHTGNEVVDIILTEKSLYCSEKHIQFTCMSNCKNLNIIKDGDLYCLFGNMIDNAIEAIDKIENPDKKCITLNIDTQGNLLTITISNYFEGKLTLDEDGLPITSKEDKDYHGFGIKSIQMIVEKYNGNFSIVLDDNIFRLNILIPIVNK